jgi:hypothetical protein
MGADKIRHVLFLKGGWRWRPTAKMRAKGFKMITLGPVLDAPARARALAANDEWDRIRRGAEPSPTKIYPHGSVGEAYQRALKLRDAEWAAKGKTQSREQTKRDDWPRAWKYLEPMFADLDPRTIPPEFFLCVDASGKPTGLVPKIEKVSLTERHRVIKVWRALWKKMATMHYCEADKDPSKVFANSAPQPRQALWDHHEVLKLVQRAWRENKRGLAAVIAVAWDTMLSPVDVRTLTKAQMREDGFFALERAKTGRAAAGTLTRYSQAILSTYLARLGCDLMDAAPLFRTAGSDPGPKGGRRWAPQPYTKDRLEKDFAEIRALVFGLNERRQLSDMRRSGHVEGDAGGATPSDASAKMANTISVSNRLRKTYNPVNVVAVRRFDEAREVGRKQLSRTNRAQKSVHRSAGKVFTGNGDQS